MYSNMVGSSLGEVIEETKTTNCEHEGVVETTGHILHLNEC